MYQFQYGISCALEEQPERQPVILRGTIEEVAGNVKRIGYDGIELFIRNPRQYKPRELLSAANAYGLEYCAIATGMEYHLNRLCLISDDVLNRQAAADRLKEHLDLGAAIGCPVIVGMMRGNIPDFNRYREYEDRFTEALTTLSRYAAEAGTSIVVESILRYISNYLNSATETAGYLRRLGLPNVRLHIDTHSMVIEDRDMARSVRETADVLRYVHFSDSNRRYPGAGSIDFKSVLGALMEIGYTGYISTECQPYPTEYACAKRGLEYIRNLENILLIERSEYKGA